MTKATKKKFEEKYRQALDYIKSGKFPEAIELAIKIAEANIHYFEYMLKRISAYMDGALKVAPAKLQELVDNAIATISKQTKKNVYHYFFLGFLYNLKGDKEKTVECYQKAADYYQKAVDYYQLAILNEEKFVLGYLYQGHVYLKTVAIAVAVAVAAQDPDAHQETTAFENALKCYWNARRLMDNAVAFNSSIYLNEDLCNYLTKFTSNPRLENNTQHFDEQIKLREDLIAGFIARAKNYQEKNKLEKSQIDTRTANDQLKYLSVAFSRRAQYHQHVKCDYQEALNDYAKAIKAYPGPFYYLECGRIHWINFYTLLQATQYFQQSLFKDQKLIEKYPEEQLNIESTIEINAESILNEFKNIIKLLDLQKEACQAAKNLPEFIATFNQHVATINDELEALASNDKMEELTLLEELKQARQAEKSSAEMAKIYNNHVDKINEQLDRFNLKLLKKSEMPPTLVKLAALVATQSDIFKTAKTNNKIPSTLISTVEDDPLINPISSKL